MKKFSKVIAAIAAVTTLSMSFAGCGLVKDYDQVQNVRESRDRIEGTILKINDSIAVDGAYYAWYYSMETISAQEALQTQSQLDSMNEVSADSSASSAVDSAVSSDAAPQIDIDAVNAEVQKQITAVKVAAQKTIDSGYTLTDEDNQMINSILAEYEQYFTDKHNYELQFYYTQLYEQMGQSGVKAPTQSYSEALAFYGTTEDAVRDIVTDKYLANLYYASMVADQYASVKHILVKYDNVTRTKAEAQTIANEIKAQLNEGGDFEAIMNEKSEDGRDDKTNKLLSPNGYTFATDGSMVPQFENAAFAMAVGDISNPVNVESSNYSGYHILKKYETSLSGIAKGLTNMQITEVSFSTLETITEVINSAQEALVADAKTEVTEKIKYFN